MGTGATHPISERPLRELQARIQTRGTQPRWGNPWESTRLGSESPPRGAEASSSPLWPPISRSKLLSWTLRQPGWTSLGPARGTTRGYTSSTQESTTMLSHGLPHSPLQRVETPGSSPRSTLASKTQLSLLLQASTPSTGLQTPLRLPSFAKTAAPSSAAKPQPSNTPKPPPTLPLSSTRSDCLVPSLFTPGARRHVFQERDRCRRQTR